MTLHCLLIPCNRGSWHGHALVYFPLLSLYLRMNPMLLLTAHVFPGMLLTSSLFPVPWMFCPPSNTVTGWRRGTLWAEGADDRV